MAYRIVVLGATGFLGSAIALEAETRGHGVVRLGSSGLDLTRMEAGESLADELRPDDVLVVAAAVTPPRAQTIAGLVANVAIAGAVARALELQPVAHCVLVGSDAVYGWKDEIVTESSDADPGDHYGLAKLVAERLAQTAAAGRAPLLALRPCAVFGPGDTHVAYGPTRFVRSAVREGRITLFGEGEEVRDHLFVEDAARATVDLVDRRVDGVLNLVSGGARSFADVAARVAGLCSEPVEIVFEPRATPVRHRRFDATALTTALPEFRPTPFDEALTTTLRHERAVQLLAR